MDVPRPGLSLKTAIFVGQNEGGVAPKTMRPPLFFKGFSGCFLACQIRFLTGQGLPHMQILRQKTGRDPADPGGRDYGIFVARAGLPKNGVTPLPLFAVFGVLLMGFSEVKMGG